MTYDMLLEREEVISAAEYLRRVKAGTLDPAEARMIPPCDAHPWGGFKIRLKTPRYKSILDRGRVCA